MSRRDAIFERALLAAALVVTAAPAYAVFPWFRPNRTAGPACYTPANQQYVVVVPTAPSAVPCPSGTMKAPHPWTADQLNVPAYPWGWFGQPVHTQQWSHISITSDSREAGLMRQQ